MSLKNTAFLIQTDTTVGIVSKNAKKLAEIKQRDPKQPFLVNVSSFYELKREVRVPQKFKKRVRRAKKTTFIYPNKKAIRVVKEGLYHDFLKRFGWLYSTSANRSGEGFDFSFIKERVDIIVYTIDKLSEREASKIYLLGLLKIRRFR